MRKVSVILALGLLVIFLTGCLTTLHPIFTEKDLVYDPKLIGTWKTDGNGDIKRAVITNLSTESAVDLPGNISSIKQKGYLISYQDENGSTTERYIAFLARIGKHLYFDYYPADKKGDRKIDDFYNIHCVKMHTSYRVDILKDGNFELSQLKKGYITNLIDEKKIRISHETDADGNVTITASTQELQQYLIKYGDEPSAYESDKTTFKH